jgi:cytochrome P450
LSLLGAKYKLHAAVTLSLFRHGKVISNLDLIVDCVDQLLVKWRNTPAEKVHLDIVHQCQNLLLLIFGFITFDYDLETLDDDSITCNNELTQALHDFMSSIEIVFFSPVFVATLYLKLSSRHRRAKAVIERYLYRMIENELAESPESRLQRKRTCLIASLVALLQTDEKLEATKSEEEKKGKIWVSKTIH